MHTAVMMSPVMRWWVVSSRTCQHRADECDSCEERDCEFLGHVTPSFLFCGLVNESANDAANDGRAKDCQTVRLVVMLDMNDGARRRGRRRSWMPHGCRVVSRCAVVGNLVPMCLARSWRGGLLGRRCLFLCRCLLMRRGGTLVAPRSGSRQRRTANRHTRECRDCHLDDLLVHVTPTFPGFLPLHKARRYSMNILTRKMTRMMQGEMPERQIMYLV